MTNDERKTATAKQPKLQFHKADDFKSLYVNWVQASYTPLDISLMVGEAFAVGTNAVDVEQKCRFIFHPLEAKVILSMLHQALDNYERQFGSINLPEDHVARIGQKEVDA